jgi:hypothetical protein
MTVRWGPIGRRSGPHRGGEVVNLVKMLIGFRGGVPPALLKTYFCRVRAGDADCGDE